MANEQIEPDVRFEEWKYGVTGPAVYGPARNDNWCFNDCFIHKDCVISAEMADWWEKNI